MSGGDRMSVTICLPLVPPSANELRRKYRHWAAYAKLRDGIQRTLWGLIQGRDRAWLMAQASLGKKMRLEVSILHKRLYDVDNAVASVKPVQDALVRLKYLAGDSPDKLDLHVSQTKIRAQETWLKISEADGRME